MATACILIVRSFVINLGLYLHFDHLLGGTGRLLPSVWVLVGLTFVFGVVIAWSKDIPDLEGDRRFGIHTLVMGAGPERLLQLFPGD